MDSARSHYIHICHFILWRFGVGVDSWLSSHHVDLLLRAFKPAYFLFRALELPHLQPSQGSKPPRLLSCQGFDLLHILPCPHYACFLLRAFEPPTMSMSFLGFQPAWKHILLHTHLCLSASNGLRAWSHGRKTTEEHQPTTEEHWGGGVSLLGRLHCGRRWSGLRVVQVKAIGFEIWAVGWHSLTPVA